MASLNTSVSPSFRRVPPSVYLPQCITNLVRRESQSISSFVVRFRNLHRRELLPFSIIWLFTIIIIISVFISSVNLHHFIFYLVALCVSSSLRYQSSPGHLLLYLHLYIYLDIYIYISISEANHFTLSRYIHAVHLRTFSRAVNYIHNV